MSDVSVRGVISGFEEGERSVKGLGEAIKNLDAQARAPIRSLEDLDRALNSIQEMQKKGAINSIEAERRSAALGSQYSHLTDILDGTNTKFSELGRAAAAAAGDAVGLGGMRRAAESTGDALETAGFAVSGLTVLFGVALVAGLYKAVSSIYDAVNSTRELGGELHNLSQRTGLSVEALSGYRIIAEAGGLTTESFSTSLEKFNRKIAAAQKGTEDGTSAFERMGISIYDSNGKLKDTDTLLGEVADKFASYEDGANKTALAVELFDRAGVRMIPTLNKGADGLARMKEEARLAGIVMSGETADAADKLNENMAVLRSYGEGFWQGVASPIIEGLTKITTAMRDARSAGDGFFGSLMAGMRRAWAETFFDDAGGKLTDVNAQIAQAQATISRMEAGKAEGRGIDKGTLDATYSRLQELYRQQGLLEQQVAIETPGADFTQGTRGSGGIAPPPIAKPKKAHDVKSMEDLDLGLDAALATALESERQYYRDLKELGQVSEMDYRRMLDQQMDDTEEGSLARLAVEKSYKEFIDGMNKEYLRNQERLIKQEVTLTKEKTAAERAESAQSLQILREEYQERARAIQMDASLNATEKNRAMQDLADELVWYKDTQTAKREVDDLERTIRRQGRDIEARETQAFYSGLKKVVSENLFALVKGTQSMGDSVRKVFTGIFDSILRKATDFVADKAVDYVLVMMGLKEGKASGAGMNGLLAPVFSAFGNLGSSIGNVVSNIGRSISDVLSGVNSTVGSVGEGIGAMASSAFGFLSELAASVWSILSNIISGIGGAVSRALSSAGGTLGSFGSTLSSIGSGVGGGVDSIGGALSGWLSDGGTAALETLGVGLPTAIGEAAALETLGVGLTGIEAAGSAAGLVSSALPVVGALLVGTQLMGFWDDRAPVYGPGTANPPGSAAYEEYMVYLAEHGEVPIGGYATGTDRIVTNSTMFKAGEAGPERVTISPLSGAARHGMGGGAAVSFNGPVVMDYYTMRQFVRNLEKYSR